MGRVVNRTHSLDIAYWAELITLDGAALPPVLTLREVSSFAAVSGAKAGKICQGITSQSEMDDGTPMPEILLDGERRIAVQPDGRFSVATCTRGRMQERTNLTENKLAQRDQYTVALAQYHMEQSETLVDSGLHGVSPMTAAEFARSSAATGITGDLHFAPFSSPPLCEVRPLEVIAGTSGTPYPLTPSTFTTASAVVWVTAAENAVVVLNGADCVMQSRQTFVEPQICVSGEFVGDHTPCYKYDDNFSSAELPFDRICAADEEMSHGFWWDIAERGVMTSVVGKHLEQTDYTIIANLPVKAVANYSAIFALNPMQRTTGE